jgi:alkylation response protein AidB-like acyl-CoA dehydrogenase
MSHYNALPIAGLESTLSETEQLIQDNMHRFAKEVLRPVSAQLDTMTPEETIAPNSPLWAVLQQASTFGLSVKALAELPSNERSRLMLIASEELAWGDGGLAGMILVSQMPALYAALAGNMAMVEYCDGKLGCWGITEPDHGSDTLDAYGSVKAVNESYGQPNCIAKIEGDHIIINGQKSAWVSGAMTAQVCALYCHIEEAGETKPGAAVIVPLDLPGVSRGKPLDKLGFRSLNQGELFFDHVKVPISHLLVGSEDYRSFVDQTLTEANVHVANVSVGIARSAYEHALAYAHERKQGGQAIILHQNVKYRLFHMFRKVEMARAITRRAAEYNANASIPALQGSIAAKVSATQIAFEVANEALQIFGANGLTKEYPMEKLLRDARAGLIADGCNEVLAIKGGSLLVNPELL